MLTRDGTSPGELLALGIAEFGALPKVTVRDARVAAIEPAADDGLVGGLRVRLADGTAIDAEVVVLATGARDLLPEVEGLPKLWGRRVHSCPFCDGEQYAGRRGPTCGGTAVGQEGHGGTHAARMGFDIDPDNT